MHAIKDENATKFNPPPAAIPKMPAMKRVAWIPRECSERVCGGDTTYIERHLSPNDIGQGSPQSRTYD